MNSPRWWCLQHAEPEGPATIAEVMAGRGLPLRVCRVDLGEPVPDPAEVDGLIVMGGPMNALDDAHHPHLAVERALIANCVDRQVPVLGVCLGAQLLAAALGARVFRGPEPEIGGGTVTLTADGCADPVFGGAASVGGAASSLPVVHWHGDTFDLPAGATWLASSDRYAHQAFRVGERAYGLQFHVELGPDQHPMLSVEMPADVAPSLAQLEAIQASGRAVLSRFFDLVTDR